MPAICARFDGRVIIPEQPVDLRPNQRLVVRFEPLEDEHDTPPSALEWLAENATDADLPTDLAEQHDHYLYGTSRKGP